MPYLRKDEENFHFTLRQHCIGNTVNTANTEYINAFDFMTETSLFRTYHYAAIDSNSIKFTSDRANHQPASQPSNQAGRQAWLRTIFSIFPALARINNIFAWCKSKCIAYFSFINILHKHVRGELWELERNREWYYGKRFNLKFMLNQFSYKRI